MSNPNDERSYTYYETRLKLLEALDEIEILEREKALQREIDYLKGKISFYKSLGDTESTAYAERLHKKYDDLISIKHELTTIKEDIVVLTGLLKSHAIHELNTPTVQNLFTYSPPPSREEEDDMPL